MSDSRVAALQMVSGNDLEQNLQQAAQLLRQAADAGARLAVLPETFALFSAREQAALGRRELAGEARVRPLLAQLARELKLWIVAGTIPIAPGEQRDDERVYAACLVINDAGEEVARYDKMHLFDVDVADQQGSYRESDTFLHGDRAVVVDTPVGRLGLAVCYDLRFPELFRHLLNEGAELIAVPSAFTRFTGEAHWLPLLRARAIENQCLMIGANQGGRHSPRRDTSGGSVIVDAWGTVLAEAGRGSACISACFDRAAQNQMRQDMPVRQHQRYRVLPRD